MSEWILRCDDTGQALEWPSNLQLGDLVEVHFRGRIQSCRVDVVEPIDLPGYPYQWRAQLVPAEEAP